MNNLKVIEVKGKIIFRMHCFGTINGYKRVQQIISKYAGSPGKSRRHYGCMSTRRSFSAKIKILIDAVSRLFH